MKATSILHGRVVAISTLLACFMISCTLNSHLPSKSSLVTTPAPRALVTFIIPTIGRPTLRLAIASLQKQKNTNWEAIVIFDGVKPSQLPTDRRVRSLQLGKTGTLNYAGRVRNVGMEQVTTEWIAFLDDDDVLSDDYIDRLLEEINLNDKLDVVIFRMYHPNRGQFIPAPEAENFSEGNVGISFSMKTTLYRAGFKFIPSGTEDFNLLDRIRSNGYKMVLSPYITYWIREARDAMYTTCDCNRAYINV